MKVKYISKGDDFSIVCFEDNLVFKRYGFDDWIVVSEKPFYAENVIDDLEEGYQSYIYSPSVDEYRDKVIIEISVKMLESGDGCFKSRLKSTVDQIMEYRNENNL